MICRHFCLAFSHGTKCKVLSQCISSVDQNVTKIHPDHTFFSELGPITVSPIKLIATTVWKQPERDCVWSHPIHPQVTHLLLELSPLTAILSSCTGWSPLPSALLRKSDPPLLLPSDGDKTFLLLVIHSSWRWLDRHFRRKGTTL